MDRIKELNKKNEGILQPYRKLKQSNTGIINNHLGYFLSIGLAYTIVSFVLNVSSSTSEVPSGRSVLLALLMFVITLIVYVGVTSWQLNLYRAVIEKTADKTLTLKETSFIPEFNKSYFKRGFNFIIASFVYGLIIGAVLIAVILGAIVLLGVGLVTGSGLSVALLLLLVLLGLLLGILISPFIMPLTTLYVFYGEDLGIGESISLSFKIGKNHYGKLLIASIKVSLVKILGLALLVVGYVYTSVWGMLIEIDTVSSILGVSLRDGHTFDGKVKPSTIITDELKDTGNVELVVEDESTPTGEVKEAEIINDEDSIEDGEIK